MSVVCQEDNKAASDDGEGGGSGKQSAMSCAVAQTRHAKQKLLDRGAESAKVGGNLTLMNPTAFSRDAAVSLFKFSI